jgi:hypothetical protein
LSIHVVRYTTPAVGSAGVVFFTTSYSTTHAVDSSGV